MIVMMVKAQDLKTFALSHKYAQGIEGDYEYFKKQKLQK